MARRVRSNLRRKRRCSASWLPSGSAGLDTRRWYCERPRCRWAESMSHLSIEIRIQIDVDSVQVLTIVAYKISKHIYFLKICSEWRPVLHSDSSSFKIYRKQGEAPAGKSTSAECAPRHLLERDRERWAWWTTVPTRQTRSSFRSWKQCLFAGGRCQKIIVCWGTWSCAHYHCCHCGKSFSSLIVSYPN